MNENKRYTYNGVSIVDHVRKDLIYVGGNDKMSDLAEYVVRLQDENEQLRKENNRLIVDYNGINGEYEWFKKENKDLRQMVDFYKDFQKDVRKLTQENDQLKCCIEELTRELNESSRQNRRFEIFIQQLQDIAEENGSLSKCRVKAQIQWFREQC